MTQSMILKRRGFAALLLAGFTTLQTATVLAEDAAKPKAVLVELFTSEGCSSCPPADDFLRQINGTRTPGNQLIVGISEHVTYWNQLGWTDPYSSANFTDRQAAYKTRFNLDSVYTPQMVVNGAEQFGGSDRNGLRKAVEHQLDQKESVAIQILTAKVDNGRVTLNFTATADPLVKHGDIFAVIADDVDESSVARGENSGRKLTHVAVARSIAHVARLQPESAHTVTFALPPSFRAAQAHHLIVFAQTPGNGRVLGVDTRPL